MLQWHNSTFKGQPEVYRKPFGNTLKPARNLPEAPAEHLKIEHRNGKRENQSDCLSQHNGTKSGLQAPNTIQNKARKDKHGKSCETQGEQQKARRRRRKKKQWIKHMWAPPPARLPQADFLFFIARGFPYADRIKITHASEDPTV